MPPGMIFVVFGVQPSENSVCTKVAQLHSRICSCALFLAPTTMSEHREDRGVRDARNNRKYIPLSGKKEITQIIEQRAMVAFRDTTSQL